MPNAFRRIRVEPNVSAILGCGSYVEWFMDARFNEPGPWTFYVERANEVNGQYAVVATTVNQPFAYDETVDGSDKSGVPSWWYRIRVKTANGRYFLSDAVSAGDTWDKRDWLVANRIIKKEMLLLRKRSGQDGVLLKRKTFGLPCPKCLDPATGEPTNSHCDVCFGTGFDGGYYAPIDCWIACEPNVWTSKVGELGHEVNLVEKVRALATPPFNPNDIWVSSKTGQCYRTGSAISTLAHIRGVPIICGFGLELLESSNVVYTYVSPHSLSNKESGRTNKRTT